MKRVFALLMACAMVVALAACGAPADNNKLTMVTEAGFPPFEYMEGDQLVGADIDLGNEIASILGRELEITNIDFDSVLSGVATGKYDIAVAGITANEERKQNMNFTDAYFTASQAIVVTADSAIKGVADLEGKVISCQEGTTGEQFLLDNGYSIQSFKTGAEGITALISGKVDALVIDNAVAKALSEKQEGKTVVLEEALSKEEYAIALKKGNDELTAEINAALAQLRENGKLAEIMAKYDLPYEE